MKTTLILIGALALAGCADPRSEKVINTLQNAGYTDVHLTGFRLFSCSGDDTFGTGFDAKGPTGRRVTGTVCSNLVVKGSTIRLD